MPTFRLLSNVTHSRLFRPYYSSVSDSDSENECSFSLSDTVSKINDKKCRNSRPSRYSSWGGIPRMGMTKSKIRRVTPSPTQPNSSRRSVVNNMAFSKDCWNAAKYKTGLHLTSSSTSRPKYKTNTHVPKSDMKTLGCRNLEKRNKYYKSLKHETNSAQKIDEYSNISELNNLDTHDIKNFDKKLIYETQDLQKSHSGISPDSNCRPINEEVWRFPNPLDIAEVSITETPCKWEDGEILDADISDVDISDADISDIPFASDFEGPWYVITSLEKEKRDTEHIEDSGVSGMWSTVTSRPSRRDQVRNLTTISEYNKMPKLPKTPINWSNVCHSRISPERGSKTFSKHGKMEQKVPQTADTETKIEETSINWSSGCRSENNNPRTSSPNTRPQVKDRQSNKYLARPGAGKQIGNTKQKSQKYNTWVDSPSSTRSRTCSRSIYSPNYKQNKDLLGLRSEQENQSKITECLKDLNKTSGASKQNLTGNEFQSTRSLTKGSRTRHRLFDPEDTFNHYTETDEQLIWEDSDFSMSRQCDSSTSSQPSFKSTDEIETRGNVARSRSRPRSNRNCNRSMTCSRSIYDPICKQNKNLLAFQSEQEHQSKIIESSKDLNKTFSASKQNLIWNEVQNTRSFTKDSRTRHRLFDPEDSFNHYTETDQQLICEDSDFSMSRRCNASTSSQTSFKSKDSYEIRTRGSVVRSRSRLRSNRKVMLTFGGPPGKSPCPYPRCSVLTYCVKEHTMSHLPWIFHHRESYRDLNNPEFHEFRLRALRCLAKMVPGTGGSLAGLVKIINNDRLIPRSSLVHHDSQRAMRKLCVYCELPVPETFKISPINSFASLIHWRVLCVALAYVSLSDRKDFENIFRDLKVPKNGRSKLYSDR